jgi:hypothetical protein
MHNLFEPATAVEILSRVDKLQPSSQPLWGKMNVSQMMAHCQAPFEVFFDERNMKRKLMGVLFGKIAKRKLFSDKPWSHGLPTDPKFIIKDERKFQSEKEKLVNLINRFATEGYKTTEKLHPFFGKLSSQEWALFHYKHLDHHLHQFGV